MAQIPSDLQQYECANFFLVLLQKVLFLLHSSYVTDPQWARKFTIAWTSVTAAGIIISLPRFYRYVREGRAFVDTFGVRESWKADHYVPVEERQPGKRGASWKFWVGVMRARAIFAWTFPGFDVSVGQSEPGLPSRFGRIHMARHSAAGSGVLRRVGELHSAQIRALHKLESGK